MSDSWFRMAAMAAVAVTLQALQHVGQCCCALQVGAEKEKVNAENESAQVEAAKCAVIASEVSEKQASCERDLAAAEPLVQQAEAALDTLNKKDLGETKSLKKPPPGV
jgi:dynein heavy chain